MINPTTCIDLCEVVELPDNTDAFVELYEYYSAMLEELLLNKSGNPKHELPGFVQEINQNYQLVYIRTLRHMYAEGLIGESHVFIFSNTINNFCQKNTYDFIKLLLISTAVVEGVLLRPKESSVR